MYTGQRAVFAGGHSLCMPVPNSPPTEDPIWHRIAAEFERRKTRHLAPANWLALAKLLGTSKQAVTNWKTRGVPPKEHLAIAQVLGWSTDQLLGIEPLDEGEAADAPPPAGPALSIDVLQKLRSADTATLARADAVLRALLGAPPGPPGPGDGLDQEALAVARQVQDMSREERDRVRLLLTLSRNGVDPPELKRAAEKLPAVREENSEFVLRELLGVLKREKSLLRRAIATAAALTAAMKALGLEEAWTPPIAPKTEPTRSKRKEGASDAD